MTRRRVATPSTTATSPRPAKPAARNTPARTVTVVLALAALLTACGSTVQSAGSATATAATGAGANSGLGIPAANNNPTAANQNNANPISAGGPSSNASSSAGAANTATAPTTQQLVQQVRTGTGPVSVRLGVVYLKGLDQAYKAVGGMSNTTNSQADYAAVIAYLNSRPNHRLRLLPSYYAVDASKSQSQDQQVQAACSYFTSDVHVDLVASYSAGQDGALGRCLAGHHIPLVDGYSEADLTEAALNAAPDLWLPSQLSLDRLGTLEPTYLVQHGWINSRWPAAAGCTAITQPRLGVITFDRPDWRAVYNNDIAPTFKRLGHPVYDAAFLSVSGSTEQQVADASSAAQNAALKFASECIDHVAFVSNVAVDYLFMNIAAQQQYTPRYGLSSLESPPVIVQNLPTSAASQLHGSMGPGWSAYSDVAITDFDAAAKAPGALCMSILHRAGIAPTDNNSAILALPSCDGPLFVAAVLDRWIAGGATASLLSIVDSLGAAYHPAGAFTARFNATQHDGAAAYRGVAFVDSCTCFRYSSAVTTF